MIASLPTCDYIQHMGYAYSFENPDGIYLTTTVAVQWVDVFTRSIYHKSGDLWLLELPSDPAKHMEEQG